MLISTYLLGALAAAGLTALANDYAAKKGRKHIVHKYVFLQIEDIHKEMRLRFNKGEIIRIYIIANDKALKLVTMDEIDTLVHASKYCLADKLIAELLKTDLKFSESNPKPLIEVASYRQHALINFFRSEEKAKEYILNHLLELFPSLNVLVEKKGNHLIVRYVNILQVPTHKSVCIFNPIRTYTSSHEIKEFVNQNFSIEELLNFVKYKAIFDRIYM